MVRGFENGTNNLDIIRSCMYVFLRQSLITLFVVNDYLSAISTA